MVVTTRNSLNSSSAIIRNSGQAAPAEPSSKIILPATCKCGSATGALCNDEIICNDCGEQRHKMSDATAKFIAGVTKYFGEPASVVLRKSDTLTAIAKQDEFLKRKRTPFGETWFNIIADNIQPASEVGGFAADPEELLEIAPDLIDARPGNDKSISVEESENSND